MPTLADGLAVSTRTHTDQWTVSNGLPQCGLITADYHQRTASSGLPQCGHTRTSGLPQCGLPHNSGLSPADCLQWTASVWAHTDMWTVSSGLSPVDCLIVDSHITADCHQRTASSGLPQRGLPTTRQIATDPVDNRPMTTLQLTLSTIIIIHKTSNVWTETQDSTQLSILDC